MPRPADRAHPVTHSPRTISAASIPIEMLDQDALRVVARLEREGHQAYLVGGCVRDLLIGRTPKDFDVATDAHPRQIKRMFRNGRIIGRRFKLVHIHYGDHIIETATFRSDPFPRDSEIDAGETEAEGARRLDDLLIVEDNEFGTAEEDARRRDFTVNALFLDPTKRTVIDYVGGLEDLEHAVLRTIGDPSVRLAEDPVRILRAVKFATRLGFRIDEKTWAAMCAIAPRLSRSAPPRVLEEILRLMRSGVALGSFRMLRACGALAVILPAIDRYLGPKDDSVAQTRAEGFWRLLEALDADVHQGFVPSTSVCIALLYLRIIEREADPATRELRGPAPDLVTVTAEVLIPVGLQTRLPRRETARARKIILLQRRFVQSSTKRFRPIAFLKSDEFLDALELFRLRIAARGQGWDIYEGWKERHRLAQALPVAEVEAERAPRRRRRRKKTDSSGPGPASAD
ncbi:MAG: polynucleotide adenylyltransferase PcnB [Planctomycetota bacterium]|nr:polynucleotide adenylyltransferase PcnB [Planctomycetota bacterium]